MKLYTVQSQCVVDELNKSGIVYPLSIQATDEYENFKKAYAWMYHSMKLFRKDMGLGNGGMFWSFHKKNDCKYYKGQGLLLEIQKPIEEILVSNHEMWHCVLNNSPIETDEKSYDFFDEHIKNNKIQKDIYLLRNWRKILDLKITKNHRIKPGPYIIDWFESDKPTNYQACFTFLKISDVVSINSWN